MNSLLNILCGLTSSLFLTVGLTRFSEKLDPMRKQIGELDIAERSTIQCIGCVPCNFTPQAVG